MNNIFAFHGSDHKAGTTQLAQCCAERLSESRKDITVLLVHGDGGRGSEYCSHVYESVEKLRPFVASEHIDIEELKARSFYSSNLYIWGGYESPDASDIFTPDMAELLLAAAGRHFDIIIVDTGSRLEDGLALGSVFAADRVYMVFNQRESSLQRYEWLSFLYDRIELKIEGFIINRYEPQSLYEKDYIAERLLIDKQRILTVREDAAGLKAESEGKSLIALKASKGFVRDIDKVIKDILDYVRL